MIVEKETIDIVKEACKGVHHSIQFLGVGEKVPGTVNFEDLLEDDGSGKLFFFWNSLIFRRTHKS